VAENFDTGPLSWVKDQINQLLESVLVNVSAVQANIHDTSPMRLSQTSLYQATGALDMVGLEGCKRFSSELEKLASKLEKKTINATPELIAAFEKAVKTLQSYLQELLNGSPDIPLRLYTVLNPIVVAQGESLEESELFFPDTSNNAPKSIPSKELSDAEYAGFIVEQRVTYQKSLLNWLQTKQASAVESMTEAVSNVSQAQQKNSNKTLWWAASAFTESLAQKEIAENQGAKKLCRKLDQELKLFADGVSKPHNNLLRDILYYVAISEVDKASVLQVKEVFELDQFIDKKSSANFIGTSIDANETALVEQLIEELEVLRDLWDEISNTLNFSKIDSKTSTSPVHIDNVLITKFSDAIGTSQDISENLSQVLFVDFYSVLQQASNTLRDDASKVNHAALIEVAAALNLIQSALNNYSDLDPEQIQKLHSELLRLESISSGEVYDKLENDRAGELDRDTVKAVVAHIHESLKVVEQALDSYFRNPTEKAPLTLTPQPIKQVSAVFDMLGLPTPTAIANASSQYIHYFQQDSYEVNQADFELVAESLSMLGLYADEMPKTRPESEKALEGALQRLNTALVNAGVMTAKAPVEAIATVGKVKTKTKKASKSANKIPTKSPAVIEDVVEQSVENVVEEAPVEANLAVTDGPTIIDQAFDPELLDIYLEEAEEVLAHIAQNCQALRVNVTDNDALIEVRRSFHTLKGSGRTVGLNALGEVAGQVEFFLNGVLDKKVTLNLKQVSSIEQVAAAFAGWTAELRANKQVAVNQEAWLARIAELPSQDVAAQAEIIQIKAKTEKTKAKTPKKLEAQILIGGTRKMSRAFYDIFMLESGQNVTILEQDVAKVNADRTLPPSKAALHANHTLASNALAAEFTPMGELSRALEQWLDETRLIWAGQHVVLYTNTVKVLSGMWQKISEQNNPRSANALIKVLADATVQARQHQELAVVSPIIEDTEQVEVITETEPIVVEELPAVEELAAEPAVTEEPAVTAEEANAEESPALEESNLADFEVKLITEGKRYTSGADSEAATFGSGLDGSKVDQELLTMFIEEAREIMPEVGADLRAWRANPKQMKHPDALQRALHTLKGSARMAGQVALGDAVHELEDEVIRSLKRKNAEIDFETMFVELDKIGGYFEQTMVATPEDTINQMQTVDAPPSGRATDRKAQFLRMRADTLDRLINEAGEISIIRSRLDRELNGFKQSSHDLTDSLTRLRGYLRELEIEAETQLQSRMSILQEANETFDPLEFDRFTRLQELTRMIAESVNDVGTIQNSLIANLDQSEAALQQQNRMNRDLQQNLLGVRMLPFKQISERMQRIVRQTARELKKSVNLVIEGESTDIDRSVLDKLGAPLEHLLRNAVAHGIEMPAERKMKNKPDTGTITLKIRQENEEIQIAVSDDGAGIDLARVKEKAIKNKLIDAKAEVSDQALMSVIFETGFSTADKVSQISGRGVGLDVVRNDISGLGGRVELSSEFGKGTLFNVNLPVTLSVAQVLVVRSGTATYALPVGIIEQAQKIKRQVLADAYAAEQITWADKQYAMHYIGTLLGQQEQRPEDHAYNSVLLLRVGSFNIALHVDEVIGNQEAVMKPIGAQLARVPGIVGATVTGDGSVMLIINPVQLVARAILTIGTSAAIVTERTSLENVLTKYRVMVVDDSLTMRKVLSRLLEREGFEVIVAKDGIDAMQTLLDVTPDAILTDIEMPRMDGFALARNIRDDKRTATTPLIMISSRTADKHQNLAKEIGVDAFFGKPVQDSELVSKVMELLTSKRQLH
jgi:chemosensory pili system protein ChpA (sensor histidine kinase/response regulator)